MKKGRIIARPMACVLTAAAMLAGSVTGCGKKNSGDSLIDQAKSGSKEYVFRNEALDFLPGSDYSSISIVGEKIYASTYSINGYITISSFNSDGSDLKNIKIAEPDGQSHGYLSYDKDGNIYTILNIYHFEDDGEMHIMNEGEEVSTFVVEDEASADAGDEASTDASGDAAASDDSKDADAADSASSEDSAAVDDAAASEDSVSEEGTEGMHEYLYDDSEEETYLVKYDPDGNELYRVDLVKDIPKDEYFSVYTMIYSEEYGLLLSSNMGIESFNEDNKTFKKLVNTKDNNSKYYESSISLYNGFGGKVFASLWGESGIEFMTFDPTNGSFGEKSSQFISYDDYSFFSGNGYDIYVSKQDGFYGYDLNKDLLVKIMDYSDSDLSLNYSINSVVALSDNEFIANLPDEEYNYSLRRLTKVPADQVKDRTVITLAGDRVDYDVRQKVYKFNQENPDFKIKVVDYSSLATDDDWNAGYKQLNLDIVSGNIPDIMFFSSDEPVDTYINKGLFLDLMPYIKNDKDLANVEFVQNVFDAFKTGDKLYQLVPAFYINTVSARSSILQGKDTITIAECRDMIESKGISYSQAFGIADKTTMLYNGIASSGNKFIDWEKKECHFDSDGFIELLEFANEFPKEITEDMWMDYDDACFYNGDALFDYTYLSNYRAFKRTKDGVFGADISLIGFPNDLGINCSVINPSSKFAISARTKYADTCWELIRQYLLPEYQDKMTYEFPITKAGFDNKGKEALERPYWTDSTGKKIYEDDTVYMKDQEIKINPLTQDEVDFVKDFISTLSLVNSPNPNVYSIIEEEASAYFSGQKSAKEVADIIQSRLSIYVNENS